MKRRLTLCIGLACAFALPLLAAGCRTRSYVVVVENRTGSQLTEVSLGYDEQEFRAGVLVRDSRKEWIGSDFVARRGTLSWRTADGRVHRADFEVASQLARNLDDFNSEVWIGIEPGDTVSVSSRPRVHVDRGMLKK